MDVKRRLVGLTAFAWLSFCVPLAEAGPLDACAQRVIRDWYSGGRVDELYPLGCYRAAIRALPNDVLEYSDADKDIARALAFARKARAVESEPAAPATPETEEPEAEPSVPSETEPVAPVTESPPPMRPPPAAPPAAPDRTTDAPRRVAAGPDPAEVSATVPYPVIVLASLAGTLLAMGAAGWLLARRR